MLLYNKIENWTYVSRDVAILMQNNEMKYRI